MTSVTHREIKSLANDTVKWARSLHLRKDRESSGFFLAEGLKIAIEAMQLGFAPHMLMFGPDAREHPLVNDLAEHTARHGGEVIQVSREILEKISRRENPQMVLAVFRQFYRDISSLQPGDAPCWVALQAVRDPGNLGTIIRTADAAGCGGVILVGDCCDAFSVEAVRATMGSIFATPIYRATIEAFTAWRAHWPGAVIGTLLSATQDFRTAPYRAPNLILMGNEQQGLPSELAGLCDVNVKIPMRGRADSLNLSVATGVMIYAAT